MLSSQLGTDDLIAQEKPVPKEVLVEEFLACYTLTLTLSDTDTNESIHG
jgi:hypothetical protein